ncbi:13893_t:CDS:2 [Entrophospora sp. SA101]|nr:13893_t:CDS:2 [Entrophospora sp. SA101]
MKFTLILLVLVTIVFNIFAVTGANLGRKRDVPLFSGWKEGIVAENANSSSLVKRQKGCADGYSPCPSGGCCPTGVECLPDKCNLKCQPSDPVCGDGCCKPG